MAKSDGIGNFVLSEDEMRDSPFDIFSVPEHESHTVYGIEREIRLLTLLERLYFMKCYLISVQIVSFSV